MSFLVGLSSAGSLCAIAVALVTMASLYNDLSSLQEEVNTGMAEFRVSYSSFFHMNDIISYLYHTSSLSGYG